VSATPVRIRAVIKRIDIIENLSRSTTGGRETAQAAVLAASSTSSFDIAL
jgi:hypothetical protein